MSDGGGAVRLEAAAGYVRERADAVQRARLAALVGDAGTEQAAGLAYLAARQRADGGFAAWWAPDTSSLDATAYRLDQLTDLGVEAPPVADRARAFLAGRQCRDGSFAEDGELAAVAPPWARPDDTAATLYLTANCAGMLLGSHPDAVAAAAGYLAAEVGPDGSLPTFVHGRWLAVPVLRAAGHGALAGRVLATVTVEDLGPTALAWLARTVAGTDVATSARSRLARCQRPDGGWTSEDGPDQDVETTLAALRVLA